MTTTTPLTPIADKLEKHGARYYNNPRWHKKVFEQMRQLERIIADAPHMERCDFAFTGKCVCWKSAARREG